MAKKKPVVTASVETLTYPEIVEITNARPKNRPIRKSTVKLLARLMVEGGYDLEVPNGEAIIFDPNDGLIDGQHRLLAFRQAVEQLGLPETATITCVVSRGVPTKFFATIDQGNVRNLKDVVDLDGHPYAADLAVAVRLLHIRLKGGSVKTTGKLTPAELLEVLRTHPDLVKSMDYIAGVSPVGEDDMILPVKSFLSPGYAATIHYLMSTSFDSDTADQFVDRLCNQDIDDKDCPVVTLRKLLLKNRQNTEAKMQRDAILDYVVYAGNLFARGEKATRLKLPRGLKPGFNGLDRVGMDDEE